MLPSKKIYIISLGCPRNLVDTEVMLGILLKAGYAPTEALEEADVILINTCGFLQAARDEAIETIQECLENRKNGAKVVACGCMVQNHSGEILEQCPEVDYLLGSGETEKILAAIEAKTPGSKISSEGSYLECGSVPRQLSTPAHYAYLKVAEGCRKRCSYCIIPAIKGSLKSKPVEQVLTEMQSLLKQGVEEIILIAQDLGDWGKDLGLTLPHLLKEMLKVEGRYWLRLLYLYPDEIDDEIIDLMKNDSRICPYLDMPIQHINDDILRAMRRKTSNKQIREILLKLRQEVPDITLRTSLIVGFPGETEKQFQELVDFIEEGMLDNVGVFTFSPEPGSRAALLPDQVTEEVKERRYDILMQAQQKVVAKKLAAWVGKTVEAFVEGYHPESDLLMIARHRGQCPDIDGCIIVNDTQAVTAFGQRIPVEITGVAGYDLIGRAIEEE